MKEHYIPRRRQRIARRLGRDRALSLCNIPQGVPLHLHSDTPGCGNCRQILRLRPSLRSEQPNLDHGGHVDLVEPTPNGDDWTPSREWGGYDVVRDGFV